MGCHSASYWFVHWFIAIRLILLIPWNWTLTKKVPSDLHCNRRSHFSFALTKMGTLSSFPLVSRKNQCVWRFLLCRQCAKQSHWKKPPSGKWKQEQCWDEAYLICLLSSKHGFSPWSFNEDWPFYSKPFSLLDSGIHRMWVFVNIEWTLFR